MSTAKRWLSIAALVVSAGLSGWAADVKIIANSSVAADSISSDELKSVFLLRRHTLQDGSIVAPVVLKAGASHELFLKQYLRRDPEEIRIYYRELVFTGKAPMPKEVESDVEMVTYVARTRGAIGYVGGDAATDGVKVLAVVTDDQQERPLLTRVDPEYPATLRELGIGGIVKLELTVSPKGAVQNVLVLGGNPILAEAAVKAVKQWVYGPSASTTKMQVTLRFDSRR